MPHTGLRQWRPLPRAAATALECLRELHTKPRLARPSADEPRMEPWPAVGRREAFGAASLHAVEKLPLVRFVRLTSSPCALARCGAEAFHCRDEPEFPLHAQDRKQPLAVPRIRHDEVAPLLAFLGVLLAAHRIRDHPAVALVALTLPSVLHPLERRDDLFRLPSGHGCQRSGNDQLSTGLPH
eukprot:scaffold123079_cov63-Phaeocystis_antarctica.AAC.5